MKLDRRRYWLHCTQDDHGQAWDFELKAPRLMGTGEPPTPRLCVAPSIARCMVGALPNRDHPLYVYKTATPRKGINPGINLVHDCWLTAEHWLVTPGPMVLDRVVPAEVCLLYAEHVRKVLHTNGNKPMSPRQKAHAFLYALDCLDLVGINPGRYDRVTARAIRKLFPQ